MPAVRSISTIFGSYSCRRGIAEKLSLSGKSHCVQRFVRPRHGTPRATCDHTATCDHSVCRSPAATSCLLWWLLIFFMRAHGRTAAAFSPDAGGCRSLRQVPPREAPNAESHTAALRARNQEVEGGRSGDQAGRQQAVCEGRHAAVLSHEENEQPPQQARCGGRAAAHAVGKPAQLRRKDVHEQGHSCLAARG